MLFNLFTDKATPMGAVFVCGGGFIP